MGIEYLGPLEQRDNYDDEVRTAALKYGLDPDLAVSVHRNEYNPNQWVSKAGARGPMQLMPSTAKDLGVDPDHPEQNIDGGVRYLKQMLDQSGGDTIRALASYNAGPGNVASGKIPTETRRYVRDVILRAKKLKQSPNVEYLGPLDENVEPEYLGPLEEPAPEVQGPPQPTYLQQATYPMPEQTPEDLALGVGEVGKGLAKFGTGLGEAAGRLMTPTEPAKDLEDWATRVLPQSANKTAFALNPLVVAYSMIKPFTDKIFEIANRSPEELAKPTFGKDVIDPFLTNLQGVSEFLGAPIGAYGLEAAKEKWLSDPVGSAVALVSVLTGGASAGREALKREPVTAKPEVKPAATQEQVEAFLDPEKVPPKIDLPPDKPPPEPPSAFDTLGRKPYTAPEVDLTGKRPEITITPEAKEPWQMTKEEYVDQNSMVPAIGDPTTGRKVIGKRGETHAEIFNNLLESEPGQEWDWIDSGWVKDGKWLTYEEAKKIHGAEDAQDTWDTLKRNHREKVEQAIAEGKEIPKEVLADYPDLSKSVPEYLGPLEETDLEAEKQAWREIYGEETQAIKPEQFKVFDEIRKSGISADSLKDFDAPVQALKRAGWVGVVKKRGGIGLDVLAADHGFADAESLYNEMLNYKKKGTFEDAPFATGEVRQDIAPVATGKARRVETGLETISSDELSKMGLPDDEVARNMLLKEAILRLPNGTYLLNTEGKAAPSLRRAVENSLGANVNPDILGKIVRGLAVEHPGSVNATLTLGLEEVRLSNYFHDKPDILKSEGKVAPTSIPPVPSTAFPPIKNESSRSAIIKSLENKLSLPIRVGRMRQPAEVAGIYKIGPKVARLRKANDVPVAIHESAHHIDRLMEMPEEMPPEVQAMAYTGAKDINREGFAEFVRYYVTEPEKALADAPNFHREFEQKLEQFPDVADLFTKVRESWKEYVAAPSVSKVMSVIQQEPGKKPRMTMNDIYTNMVDELHPLKLLKEHAEKLAKRELAPSEDPHILAWMARGWARKAEQYLKWGQFQIGAQGVEFTGPSLREILRPVEKAGERALLDTYLVAKRAVSDPRILQGFDRVLSKGDFEQTVKELEPKFKDVADRLYEYSDNLLRYLVDSGRMSEKVYDAIKEKNLFYAPFYRVMDTDPAVTGVSKRKFAELPEGTKRLKGSSRDIYSPTQNIMQNTYALMNLAERARIGQAIIKLSRIEGMGPVVEKLPVKIKPQSLGELEALTKMVDRLQSIPNSDVALNLAENLQDVRETFKIIRDIHKKLHDEKWIAEYGTDGIEELLEQHQLKWTDLQAMDDIITTFRPNYKTKPNEVILYNRGEPEVYQLEPSLYKSLMGLDSDSLDSMTKLLSHPAKLLRAGATLAPEFALRNPLRDQWSAFVFSKYNYKPGWDLIKGIYHVLGKTELYQEYNASGAAHAALVSLDRDYMGKSMKSLLAQGRGRAVEVIKNPIDMLRAFSELTEEATRVGEFARGMAKEGHDFNALLKAGQATRDMTLDFSRIGLKTKSMNAITAFWNAGVQGADKLVREFKTNPTQATVRATAAITLPSLMLYYAQKDDKDYQEIPLWRRALFWNIVTHNEDGSLNHIWSIPKPFDLGIIFGTFPEMALEYAYTKSKTGLDESVQQFFNMALPGVMPTALTPVVEWFANKSWFFGRPVVSRDTEELKPELQYGPHTSQAVRLIAKGLAQIPYADALASPDKIENFIRGYTGGLGSHALSAVDRVLKETGIVNAPTEPAMTLADIPGIRGFIQRMPAASTRSIEEFYSQFNKVKQDWESKKQEAGIRGLGDFGVKTGSPDELKVMEATAKVLSMQRRLAQLVYNNKDMTPEQKRNRLDGIYNSMIDVARKALGKGTKP